MTVSKVDLKGIGVITQVNIVWYHIHIWDAVNTFSTKLHNVFVHDSIQLEAMKREASTHSDTITSQPRRHDQSVNINIENTWESGGRLQHSKKQDSYLAGQSKTVLRCIWECSWQTLVRRATESPLRPKIGTARLAENIPNLSCIVRAHPQVYFTSYIVNDVSSRPILLCSRKNKATRNSGKRFLGNAKWR